MTTPNQKSDVKPIGFVLHDMATKEDPVVHRLVIRPEDLSINFSSRLNVHQTLGDAWADSFGVGLPTIQMSGHTGWGSGSRPDGIKQFNDLYFKCFKRWHSQRDEAVRRGQDPDLVRLIFVDTLDSVVWVVAPQSFVLKRNKSRPLLTQYTISLTKVRKYVGKDLSYLFFPPSVKTKLGLSSLDDALGMIDNFFAWIASGVNALLGPIKNAVAAFVALTAKVLNAVKSVIASGMRVVNAVTGSLLAIAGNLARAGANIMHAVQSVMSLPSVISAQFSRVASAFTNAFCVISNIFTKRKFIPNYDDLYGASNCSSTAGGSPISKYNTENPFPALLPINSAGQTVTQKASAALATAVSADWVANPPSLAQLTSHMDAISSGVALA